MQTVSSIRSPSKNGLHILGIGSGPSLNRKQAVGSNGLSIESVRSAPKYFTLTGDEWPGSADKLANLDALLDEVVRKLDAQKEPKPGRKRKPRLDDVVKHGRYELFGNDRSRAVWYVCNEAIRQGWTDDQIVAALTDLANKISEHVRDQKQGADIYARRQIAKARAEQAATEPDGGYEDTIALRFSAKYAESIRYVSEWNKWLEWDGTRWKFEKTRRAFYLVRLLCRDGGNAKSKTVAGVTTLVMADRRQAATTEQWDANRWILGTANGTVDLRSGRLYAPRPLDYITKVTSVTPGNGGCPQWLAFLDRVTDKDMELQRYLQRVFGYCLTGDISEEALFFLYGTGKNGKSVFVRTLAGVLADYHRKAPIEMLMISKFDRHPTEIAMLHGARLVTAVEVKEGAAWDEVKIKTLTGGDELSGRFMRQDFFDFIPQFKLMVAGNHRPTIRTVDMAIRRRMNLIPFTVTIPEAERIPDLSVKLRAEHPSILSWAIEGCLAWQRKGLNPPANVIAATEAYLESQDDLQTFIDDCCVVARHESDAVEHLWDGWTDWAKDCNEFVGSKRRFCERLRERGFEQDRRTGGANYFKGLRCMRENAAKLMAEAKQKADEYAAFKAKNTR